VIYITSNGLSFRRKLVGHWQKYFYLLRNTMLTGGWQKGTTTAGALIRETEIANEERNDFPDPSVIE
jgi:hypothetical protein